MGVTLERCAFAGVSPHEAFAYCMELVPVCLCVQAPANLCPCEIWSLCEDGVRRCTRLVHRATVLLRVSTVVAFCAALIGGGAVGAKAEITASVPAGVHWRASPEGMPLWGPNRFWPGSGLVLRCLGPGFTVLALGPGFRPIFIHSSIVPAYYDKPHIPVYVICYVYE